MSHIKTVITENTVFQKGKHKNKSALAVANLDPSYLLYMSHNGFNVSPNLVKMCRSAEYLGR